MSARWAGSELTLAIRRNCSSSLRYRPRSLKDGMSAINRERLAGDPGRLLGDKKEHTVRHVLRLPEPPGRDLLDQRPLAPLAVALPLPLGRRVGEHEAGRDGVDGDPEPAELVRGLAR